jgi:hypothetical protein
MGRNRVNQPKYADDQSMSDIESRGKKDSVDFRL